ncbi:hypothetical protein PTTG_12480 [Puccinia triticina 1-1 BBBD Race 1]|uniref:Uncharacterized protein n=1 Tax=Puccinia triticina (isolate 1-1 / race 1 (BBBD)) TaxID=630390 RepID=A0A180GYV5_PUCT1|nr:hypothetical protein PTTG_12480 [Puccinia triticina 1-1 BBBD Race 1]
MGHWAPCEAAPANLATPAESTPHCGVLLQVRRHWRGFTACSTDHTSLPLRFGISPKNSPNPASLAEGFKFPIRQECWPDWSLAAPADLYPHGGAFCTFLDLPTSKEARPSLLSAYFHSSTSSAGSKVTQTQRINQPAPSILKGSRDPAVPRSHWLQDPSMKSTIAMLFSTIVLLLINDAVHTQANGDSTPQPGEKVNTASLGPGRNVGGAPYDGPGKEFYCNAKGVPIFCLFLANNNRKTAKDLSYAYDWPTSFFRCPTGTWGICCSKEPKSLTDYECCDFASRHGDPVNPPSRLM